MKIHHLPARFDAMGKPNDCVDLKKQLQKSFIALKDFTKELSSLESSVRTRLKSITNLSEQLLSCKRVKDSDLPDSDAALFKDARERLVFNLTDLITEDLHELHLILQQYTGCSEKFSRQYEICLTKFDRLNNKENIVLLTERSATSPSLSEMLEMLHRSECRLRESCLAKKYILENFRPENYDDDQTLDKAWFTGDKIMKERIEGKLYRQWTSKML